jgi:hypothetical protein
VVNPVASKRTIVMPGLVPGIHVFGVDAIRTAVHGHDGFDYGPFQ